MGHETGFDKILYLAEMRAMVDKAIDRLERELPGFNSYTVSIWTDPDTAASAISFDGKENSLKHVAEANDSSKKYFNYYLAEGNAELAALFKPNEGSRLGNPANFELRDFEEITHQSFQHDWESETDGRCWEELAPALSQVGAYALEKMKILSLDIGFELAVNSERDWYDKTWN